MSLLSKSQARAELFLKKEEEEEEENCWLKIRGGGGMENHSESVQGSMDDGRRSRRPSETKVIDRIPPNAFRIPWFKPSRLDP